MKTSILLHNRRRSVGMVALAGLILAALPGCSREKGGSLSGTVTFAGKPVTGAELSLRPAVGQPILAPLGKGGTYSVSGVPPGEYKVTIVSKAPAFSLAGQDADMKKLHEEVLAKLKAEGKEADLPEMEAPTFTSFPARYADVQNTPLTVTVAPGKNEQSFDLTD